jgi:nitric oxide reductase NorQ protein
MESINPASIIELIDQPLTTITIDPIPVEESVETVVETTMDEIVSSVVSKAEETVEKKTKKPPRSYYNHVIIEDKFLVEKGMFNIIKKNIELRVNTMLLGPTGVGKTEIISYIAKDMKLPLTIFDMGTMTDPVMGLVGTHVIKVKDGVTNSEFKKSRFSDVIQQPGIILLDELSRASVAANNLLFPCLDFRRELSMEYSFDDHSSIKVHPDCVFIATANLGSSYTGTHKLDKALIDRFMILEMEALTGSALKKAVELAFPSLDTRELNTIVDLFNSINGLHDEFKISFNLSMRHLKIICNLVLNEVKIYDAFYSTCKGLGGKEGLTAIECILKPHEKKSES